MQKILKIRSTDPRLLEMLKRDVLQILAAYEHCHTDAHLKRGAQLAAKTVKIYN
jgi:hypothetical protein